MTTALSDLAHCNWQFAVWDFPWLEGSGGYVPDDHRLEQLRDRRHDLMEEMIQARVCLISVC